MFQYEQTSDEFLVRYILTHEKVYGRASDDFAPPVAEFKPRMDGVIYVLLKRDGLALGLWALMPHSPILFEVHTCLLPHAWGETAIEAVPGFLDWVWKNTTCERLITSIPEFNRAAKRFAERGGMVQYGLNPKAFKKTGTLHNVLMLGLSRPESLCP